MPIRLRSLLVDGRRPLVRLPNSVRSYRIDEIDAYNAKLVCPTTGQRVTVDTQGYVFEQKEIGR